MTGARYDEVRRALVVTVDGPPREVVLARADGRPDEFGRVFSEAVLRQAADACRRGEVTVEGWLDGVD